MLFLALGFVVAAALAGPVLAATPSFDCAKAETSAEEAVCADAGLAALDREVARLYRLALNGPHMTAEGARQLKAMQRGWIKGRDECWKSDAGLKACVAAEYVWRIHDLRQGYADARAADEAGVSLGPFAYVCEGLDAAVSAVFINAEEARHASLKWGENAAALAQAPAASGARYTGTNYAGAHEFWVKGQEAMFTQPGGARLACRQDETG